MFNRHILLIFIIIISISCFKSSTLETFYPSTPYGNYPNTIHLFWTGGFDSTFRLCQALLIEYKSVQPIYVTYDKVDDSTMFSRNHRQNRRQEITAMNNIRNLLIKQFPFVQTILYPIIYVDYIKQNKNITQSMYRLHYQFNKFTRPINQYERLSQYSYYYPFPIEVAVEKCGTGLDDATKHLRVGTGTNCRIPDNLTHDMRDYYILHNLRFPVVHMTKHDMLAISKRYGFDHILKLTWSCWFPNKDGTPCGKCDMCQHRIIN
jgi:7-cyano-7-deazaguanine synthase in queuosine biosynthesis